MNMIKSFYNKVMTKKRFFFGTLLFVILLPISVFAIRIQTYNGNVTKKTVDGSLTLMVDNGVNYTPRYKTYLPVKPTSGTYIVGDPVNFSVNEDVNPPQVVASTISKGTNANANGGVGSLSNKSTFRLFPDLSCTDTTALNCYVARVWGFSQMAVLLLAVAAFVVAGVIYMTSSGNPKQIEMAKKIIIGALSAVAVMVLGKFFLTNVVGVTWL